MKIPTLGLYALAQGWKVGRFQTLKLTHITPKGRTSAEYVARVLEGNGMFRCIDSCDTCRQAAKPSRFVGSPAATLAHVATPLIRMDYFMPPSAGGGERGLKIVLAHAKR